MGGSNGIGPNRWTNDPERAVDFGYPARAVKIATQAQMKDMELIVCFSAVRTGLRLPLATFEPST